MTKSDPEKILAELRKTLIKASREARSGKMTNDRLKNISRVANSYTKLMVASGHGPGKEIDLLQNGDSDFTESLLR